MWGRGGGVALQCWDMPKGSIAPRFSRVLWWVALGWLPAAHPAARSVPLLNRTGGSSAYLGGFSHTCCIPRDFHEVTGCSCMQNSPMGCSNGADMGLSASVSVEASSRILRLHGQDETCLLPRSYFVIESTEHVTMCSFY